MVALVASSIAYVGNRENKTKQQTNNNNRENRKQNKQATTNKKQQQTQNKQTNKKTLTEKDFSVTVAFANFTAR